MDIAHSRGQVAVYLMLSLLAVFLLALLAVDVFLSVRTKNSLQNGGDAAALAAAHRQGELINEIGRLNLEHIKAALLCQTNRCIAIGLEQRRLALLEPVYAQRFASDAAERNGIGVNDTFSEILRMHAHEIRTVYAVGGGGDGDPLQESYPGAWDEYANAVDAVASDGLAAGIDNIEYYFAYGSHLLLNPAFYNAIAGHDWCWFWFNDRNALDNYKSYHDWAPLSPIMGSSTDNSEIFSLHLSASTNALTAYFPFEEIIRIANKYGGMRLKIEDFADEEGNVNTGLLSESGYTWFFFDTRRWRTWFNGRRLADADAYDGEIYDFPIVGEIKSEYNVRGCAAVCRTYDDSYSFTADARKSISWSAAAKPFGTLDESNGAPSPVTALSAFVVPCMSDTRLVGVDSVAGANTNTADIDWMRHIRIHLPDYIQNGPKNNGGCWYCAQLKKWEAPSFHFTGATWLKYHSGECVRPVSGGVSGSGGTRRGH